MNRRVLFVDDEAKVLNSFKRQLRQHFQVETALGGYHGLEIVKKNGPFAVVVSDMKMPGMDGIQFLTKVREIAPDTVRMMLTGYADQQTAIQAINEGNIFRFMVKPCPTEAMIKSLEAGIEQYRLITAEKELLEKTLQGSIKVLTDILSLVNPKAFGRAARVRRLVKRLLDQMEVEKSWHIELAAMLSQVGCVAVPEDVLDNVYKGYVLDGNKERIFRTHPQIGHDLIANIPRLEAVAEIIAYQEKGYDGSGPPPDGKKGKDIPLGARVLKVALDYDTLISAGKSRDEALQEMRKRIGKYDPSVIGALAEATKEEPKYEIRSVKPDELRTGMILAEDVRTDSGMLITTRGQEVTLALRKRLLNFSITKPIRVIVPRSSHQEAETDSTFSYRSAPLA